MYFITCNESSLASCTIQRSGLDGNDVQTIVNDMSLAGSLRIGTCISEHPINVFMYILTDKNNICLQ